MRIVEEVTKSDKYRKSFYLQLKFSERIKMLFNNTMYVTVNRGLDIEELKAFHIPWGQLPKEEDIPKRPNRKMRRGKYNNKNIRI